MNNSKGSVLFFYKLHSFMWCIFQAKKNILGVFITILTLTACKKEQSEPMSNSVPVPLENTIFSGEKICGNLFNTDTFYVHKYETSSNGYRTVQITCRSSDTSAATYIWYFPDGMMIDSTGYEAVFSFNPDSVEYLSTRSVIVSLVTVSQNNERDSINKTIFIRKNDVPWLGTFSGYNIDNPSDTFSIYFIRTDQYGSGPACCTTYTVRNLPNGLNAYVKMMDFQGSYQFTFNDECEPGDPYSEVSGYNFSGPKGFGKISGNNILIDYYYLTPVPDIGNSTVVQKTFVGVRTQ